jgi:hypothetical protein
MIPLQRPAFLDSAFGFPALQPLLHPRGQTLFWLEACTIKDLVDQLALPANIVLSRSAHLNVVVGLSSSGPAVYSSHKDGGRG